MTDAIYVTKEQFEKLVQIMNETKEELDRLRLFAKTVKPNELRTNVETLKEFEKKEKCPKEQSGSEEEEESGSEEEEESGSEEEEESGSEEDEESGSEKDEESGSEEEEESGSEEDEESGSEEEEASSSEEEESDSEDEESHSEEEEKFPYKIVRMYENKKELVRMLKKRGVSSVVFPFFFKNIRLEPKTTVGRAIDAAEDFLLKPVSKRLYKTLAKHENLLYSYEDCKKNKLVNGHILGMNVLSSFSLEDGKLTLVFEM